MTSIIIVFFAVAGFFYAASFAYVCLSMTAASLAANARRYAWTGLAAHTLGLCALVYATRSGPFQNSYALLESLVWAFVVLQMVAVYAFKTRAVLVFSMPSAALLTLLPLCCPMLSAALTKGEPAVATVSLHALFGVFSYAFTFVAAVAGALYLWQRKRLLAKTASPIFDDVPSLKKLFALERVSLIMAAVLMFFSIAVGVVCAVSMQLTQSLAVKFSLGAFVFAMQIILCALAWGRRIPESKASLASVAVAAFAFAMLAAMQLRNFS